MNRESDAYHRGNDAGWAGTGENLPPLVRAKAGDSPEQRQRAAQSRKDRSDYRRGYWDGREKAGRGPGWPGGTYE